MTEEHKLILTLVPKFDSEALSGSLSGTIPASNNQTAAGAGAEAESYTPASQEASKSSFWSKAGEKLHNFGSGILGSLTRARDDDDDDENSKRSEARLKVISAGVQQGAKGLMSIAQTSLGFVEDIYKQMKSASPLLQSVESMFNLAVRLFFMPLGNKLAEVLIPATVQLLDEVIAIWDTFEGKSLGEVIGSAIEEGTRIFGTYILSIGDTLKEESGIVGTIGRLLTNLGDFVENRLDSFIEALLNFAGFVMEHFKGFISLYVAMQTAQISATIASGAGPVAALLAAAGGGTAGFIGTEGFLRSFGLAEGGYVPATPGGQLHILAEGGEGEYVIPESKMGRIGGNNITNNYYISGVTSEELGRMIDDRINEQISLSRIRSGF